MTRRAGAAALRALSIALWGLVVLVVASLVAPDETFGQQPHRAALIIDFGGEGNVSTACVPFEEDEISGADLLRRSGLSVVFSGFGGLGSGVCQIDGEGCTDPGNCFCQCTGANCRYWSYWVLENGAWRYQQVGASARDVVNGEVHAWVWGNGRTQPDPMSYGDVCPLVLSPTARPTARPPSTQPDATPRPSSSGQPAPTHPSGPTADSPRDTATPGATEQVRSAATPRPPGASRDDASARDGGGSGAPVGLIAFGAVAGALVLGIGGLMVRRRIVG